MSKTSYIKRCERLYLKPTPAHMLKETRHTPQTRKGPKMAEQKIPYTQLSLEVKAGVIPGSSASISLGDIRKGALSGGIQLQDAATVGRIVSHFYANVAGQDLTPTELNDVLAAAVKRGNK